MGLFSPNYDKPGKGVEKDAPKKHRIWEFFEIFWEQSSKLILANFVYSIAMIPLILGLYLCFKIDFSSASIVVLRYPGQIDLVGFILLIISVFVSFPANLGFTYILRNIQRRQHAWIWHDFIKHTFRNYSKGVLNGIVNLVMYFLLINAYGMYRAGVVGGGFLSIYLSTLMLIIIAIFTWMQFYVNTMIITFDLKFGSVYKNALIFAIGKLPLNLMISAICIVLGYILLLIPIPFITFLLGFVVWFSLFGFIVVFSVYPSIDKHMISKAKEKSEEE